MKLGSFLAAMTLCILCISCSGNKKAEKDPYEGVVLVTEWEKGPGIEKYADYSYGMGSVWGEYFIHTYGNQEKGTVAFITDADRTVIASFDIPKSELKPNQYVSFDGAIENFDPNREFWKNPYTIDPYYIVVYEVTNEDDFLEKPYFDTVVKAWHFDKETKKIVEASAEGLGIRNEAYGI